MSRARTVMTLRARRFRQHAMNISDLGRHSVSRVITEIYDQVWYNYRMTILHSPVGLVPLERTPYGCKPGNLGSSTRIGSPTARSCFTARTSRPDGTTIHGRGQVPRGERPAQQASAHSATTAAACGLITVVGSAKASSARQRVCSTPLQRRITDRGRGPACHCTLRICAPRNGLPA